MPALTPAHTRPLAAALIALILAAPLRAEEPVRLHAPKALAETGLLAYILPRFSLKTQIRVTLTDDPAEADLILGSTGRALFQGPQQSWHLEIASAHGGGARLADWLASEVGQNTIQAYAIDGEKIFGPAAQAERPEATLSFDGDPAEGRAVARARCIRCHAVDPETRLAGISSTPSFPVLRALPDWEARFSAFYALNPHPSFTILEEVTPPFPPNLPPPIAPVRLTIDELESLLAFVAGLKPADLGAPLDHQ